MARTRTYLRGLAGAVIGTVCAFLIGLAAGAISDFYGAEVKPTTIGFAFGYTGLFLGASLGIRTSNREGRRVFVERDIRQVITSGLLLAITLLLAFTPSVGFIPAPTPAGSATIVHIPAIIGGILEGPLVGHTVGFGFGLTSFMRATIPAFKDPLVAILPRLFIGVSSALVYLALGKADKRALRITLGVLLVLCLLSGYQVARTEDTAESTGLNNVAKGIIVALVATAGTAFLLLWLRREDVRVVSLALAAAAGSLTNTVLVLVAATLRGYWPAEASWIIGLTHGIPEVIVSCIVVVAVVSAIRQLGTSRRGSRL